MLIATFAAIAALTPRPSTTFAWLHAQSGTHSLSCSRDARMSDEGQLIAGLGIVAPKVAFRSMRPEERGKGGIVAAEQIAMMEVIARIPRASCLCVNEPPSGEWAESLTAAALRARFGEEESADAQRAWVKGWDTGGWATDSADLGADNVRFGAMDVLGSLLSTGSDLDHEIYKKFGLKCHPVVHRAAKGLAMLTKCDESAARASLSCRGRAYRAMREELFPLVLTPTERQKGSMRERRCWDVADILSKVLSRATTVEMADGSEACAVVPLHERLAHGSDRGANAKLLGRDPLAAGEDDLVLVATRAIDAGEELTRDYEAAPRLPEDNSDGALRLLLQFGLPPDAWPQTERGCAGPMGGFAEGEAEA